MADKPVKTNDIQAQPPEPFAAAPSEERRFQRKPAPSSRGPAPYQRSGGSGGGGGGNRFNSDGDGGRGGPGGGRRGGYFPGRRRVCPIKYEQVDWKNMDSLRYFVSDDGSIRPRRKTGANAKIQRKVAVMVKRARHMALLPYTGEHVRISGTGRR